ncbi:mechanosensitive ion channel family protein [Paraburkholderia lycopersici]|uniref:Small-conductance mechanosensitive channel n=1 Tax=Paraburkholderia lycopersici TaxID=416944 RepID=A0A1G7DAR9_9BURK|nr:mechanosensitive ion channel domain-containing protein [Paraburkholderia lycopersici]SDE48657.1 Mechanosensitive ion channel [Paraburkholderia lycopersici]
MRRLPYGLDSARGCLSMRSIMRRWLGLGLLLACLGWFTTSWATELPAELPTPASGTSTAIGGDDTGAPIVVWDRTIITLYAPYGGKDASERARIATDRINAALDDLAPEDISVAWAESGDEKSVIVRTTYSVLFNVRPGDVGSTDRVMLEHAGEQAAGVLREIIRVRAEARRPAELVKDIGFSLLVTLALVALCWLLMRANGWVQRKLVAVAEEHLKLNIGGYDLRPVIWSLLQRLAALVYLLLVLFLGYLWLSFVLRQFPYSRPWGMQLGQYLMDSGLRMLAALLGQLPNLLTLIMIYLVTRGVMRVVGSWFSAVERGTVHVGWLDGAMAAVTRKLVSALIWLFALTIAYPYIPGAGSYAFKGVSVLLGLMVSLGSSGIVNQVMSGLVVLYSRAVRVGDFVRVGEFEGRVLELGTLSMKLMTRTHEEITVPNAVLSSTPLRNLDRQSHSQGLLLIAHVTVGYDTPWRQAVALLELAAARTSGVLKEPKPFVLHTSLSDFYVKYELNVSTPNPSLYMQTLSDLYRNILDVFNEFGVQVMSPHFRQMVQEKVWVPPEHWYEAPAKPPQDGPDASSTSGPP